MTWGIRVANVKKKDGGDRESDLILHDKNACERCSGSLTGTERKIAYLRSGNVAMCETSNASKKKQENNELSRKEVDTLKHINDEVARLNENIVKLTQTIHGYADKFEEQNKKIAILEKNLLDIAIIYP